MKDLILVGAGGCMRELLWQILQDLHSEHSWNVLGYVDRKKPEGDAGCYVDGVCCPYLGDEDYLLQRTEPTNVAICVGDPNVRKKIAMKLLQNERLVFPTLILNNAKVCGDVQMGKGCIISMDCRISTNVKMGDFVFCNTGTAVCHDGQVGDFVTISPRATLAGNVKVGELSYIGLGANVIQGLEIGKNVRVGAGSVVIRNIQDDCTAVGVPTRIVQ